MSHEHGSRHGPSEVVFDVREPSGPVEFLGLLEGRGDPENRLSGLFVWTCPACAAVNKDIAVIRPNQAFRVEWSCKLCSQVMVVQCKARAAAEWVAQHARAITGNDPADEKGPLQYVVQPRPRTRSPSQKVFAWITVPTLAGIIFLGLIDARRTASSTASPGSKQEHRSPMSYSWLGRFWISKDQDDVLFFGYVNPTAHTGTYTRVARHGRPARMVRFQIVNDDGTDERFVLREVAESLNDAAPPSSDSDAILYISRRGDSMVRMTTRQGELTVMPYDHVAKPPADD
jgi:hypothetical protein